ncbi:hypothetical protein LN042_20820 [Kitasatospora sp. RB6PN24]|uniref:hypothetical protein n=1 Tax=Kitasatospora humi TaxID=2893891 RepID=UPI001E3D8E66|nr:hypothetical protein [Kitasatospora humi]MCC9309491.1 hypothetical protein [Kitasatospora humi]
MPENSDRPDRRGARAKIDAQRAVERRTRRRRRALFVLGGIIVAAAVVIAIVLSIPSSNSTSSAKTGPEGITLESGDVLAPSSTAAGGQTVDGISCSATEQVAYHIHSHLAVYVNGQSRSIPYGIGIVMPVPTTTPNGVFAQATNCYYWLHTHASDGIIHVESPTQSQYTLGQFFDIWQQPLSATQVGPATGPVTAYVNGKPYTGDPRDITLQPHEDIQLDVGTPTVAPQPVDWSRAQL